jgi:hypothetical protein
VINELEIVLLEDLLTQLVALIAALPLIIVGVSNRHALPQLLADPFQGMLW